MPTSNALSRVSSVDFFGVLPAGFYTFLSGIYCVTDFYDIGSPTVWGRLEPFAKELKDNPVTILFLLFAAYMIGAVIRVIPVDFTDELVKRVKGWMRRSKRSDGTTGQSANGHSGKFPYTDVIQNIWRALDRQKELTQLGATNFPKVDSPVAEQVLNYWKDYLCIWSARGFAEVQSLEARVRFFVGMIWAGSIGLCGGCIAILNALFGRQSLRPSLCFVLVSLAITVAFGRYLRQVRRREVRGVYRLYVACRYDLARQWPQGAADTTAGPQEAKVDN